MKKFSFTNRGVIMMQQNDFHTVRGYQLLAQGDKQLTSAMEDYLEMIYRNIRKDGTCVSTLGGDAQRKAPSALKWSRSYRIGIAGINKKYGIIF